MHNKPMLALALICLVTLSSTAFSARKQPNILLILTDDQGWATLGCYGGKIVPTPHLDRLAAEGARFTDGYVTSQCSPTRATLLTGQYTARNRLWHVLPWYGYPWARVTESMFAENYPRDTFTLAKGLRSAGYTTAIVGKWHLTNNADGNYMGLNPEAAHYYGFDFAPPVLTKEEFAPGADRGVNTLTQQAIAFIRKNRDRPWFCYLSHHMIHGIVVAPETITQKYRDLGYGEKGPNRAVYLAGLECIDRSIGRLMTALKQMGEAQDTLVIFLSDNGGIDARLGFKKLPMPHPRQPRFTPDLVEYDNAPLRAGKGSGYEGGIRVPMLVRWPGHVPAGSVVKTPVHIVDLAPTFLELAGARAPFSHPLDGESLVELLKCGDGPILAQRPIFQYVPFYDLRWGLTPSASIRQGDYKLIEFFGDQVDDDGLYIPGHRLELYNLRKDIGETTNLAERQPEITKQLRNTLHTWMKSIPANVPQLNQHHEPDRAFLETKIKPEWLR